jgi:hypothetical protein
MAVEDFSEVTEAEARDMMARAGMSKLQQNRVVQAEAERKSAAAAAAADPANISITVTPQSVWSVDLSGQGQQKPQQQKSQESQYQQKPQQQKFQEPQSQQKPQQQKFQEPQSQQKPQQQKSQESQYQQKPQQQKFQEPQSQEKKQPSPGTGAKVESEGKAQRQTQKPKAEPLTLEIVKSLSPEDIAHLALRRAAIQSAACLAAVYHLQISGRTYKKDWQRDTLLRIFEKSEYFKADANTNHREKIIGALVAMREEVESRASPSHPPTGGEGAAGLKPSSSAPPPAASAAAAAMAPEAPQP